MMNRIFKSILYVPIIIVLSLSWSPAALSKPEPGACVELGALVWNDWTKTDAGDIVLTQEQVECVVGFEFTSCMTGHVWVNPNEEMLASNQGFETFEFAVTRLTAPNSCP